MALAVTTQSVLSTHEDLVSRLVQGGSSYESISRFLTVVCGPQVRGLSSRSIRRFCSQRGLRHRGFLDDATLDRIINNLIRSVGHSYGRRTMHGLIRSIGFRVSQSRVSRSMQRVAPAQHRSRQHTINQLLNPAVYQANSFGDKLHLDQNEKCVMFGVTHVLAIDGYSRKIVGFITIPKKNPILIYDCLFRPLLLSEGLWNQVRTDHGTEFSLIATAQLYLSNSRQNQSRQPVLQSLSRQNHRAERIWPEINQRINYPIKRVLVDMENNDEISMGEELIKFCVSWVTIKVIETAVLTFVNAWNSHRIPGPQGGIPNVLALHRNVTVLPISSIPSTPHLVAVHESNGRRLSRTAAYGSDPLCNHPELQTIRERDFFVQFPSMTNVFESVLHSNGSLLRECIHYFIRITKSFSMLLE